jgi:hypothetical protein
MLRYVSLLLCTLLLALAGCSRWASNSQQQAAQPNLAAASPANTGQAVSPLPEVETSQSRIDPCALITSKELESIQGGGLKETKPSVRSEGGFNISQCFYALTTAANSVSLLVAQKGNSPGARDPKEFWRETFHRESEDERAKEKGKDKDKDKTKATAEEDEESARPEQVDGVGDEAYWTGNRIGGALYALKGNSYIRISVGGPGDEAAKIKRCKALAQIILKRL